MQNSTHPYSSYIAVYIIPWQMMPFLSVPVLVEAKKLGRGTKPQDRLIPTLA